MRNLLKRYPQLEKASNEIIQAENIMINVYKDGGKILLCGNGGSAADCDHIVGELMKSFKCKRRVNLELSDKLLTYGNSGKEIAEALEGGLPAISLCEHRALSTAYANDREPYMVFAQQLSVLGKCGDLLMVLTTSGNSKNCLYAAMTAKAMKVKVIAITGETGGKISEFADVCIKLPASETYLVQELTLPVYHYLCSATENYFYNE